MAQECLVVVLTASEPPLHCRESGHIDCQKCFEPNTTTSTSCQRIRARPRDRQVPDLTAEEERRLLASLVQMRKNLRILRTMHLQEPFVSLVVAQLHFAQHCSCDAMCARVNIILDPTCLHDFKQTESLVTEQPLICLCSQIMLATS